MTKWMLLLLAITVQAQVDFDQHLEIDKSEYKARREALREHLKAPLVLVGALASNRINDTEYAFRQESNFYYLTGFSEAGAFLVISKEPFDFQGEKVREVLFIEPDHPRAAIYNGKRTTLAEAEVLYGVEKAAHVSEGGAFHQQKVSKFEEFMKGFTKTERKFYLSTPIVNFHEYGNQKSSYYDHYKNSLLATLEPSIVDEGSQETAKLEILNRWDLFPVMAGMRSIKSEQEKRILQRAVDITLSGHEESLRIAKDVPYEYQVEAAIEYAFSYNGAEAVGYNSIVGCGANGTVLHYMSNRDGVNKQQMYVLDAGAEYKNYTADITRSFPADGSFSKEQREIYQIVLDAQTAGATQFVAGSNYGRVNSAIKAVLVEGLTRLGLLQYPVVEVPVSELKGRNLFNYSASADIVVDGKTLVIKYNRLNEEALKSFPEDAKLKLFDESQFNQLCPHGWGHSVGLDVHDPAPREYAEDMIWTIEPGIYIADRIDFEINPAYLNIGVRIEDMYLITKDGNQCMSEKLPRKIEELEAFMKQKSHLLLGAHKHDHK